MRDTLNNNLILFMLVFLFLNSKCNSKESDFSLKTEIATININNFNFEKYVNFLYIHENNNDKPEWYISDNYYNYVEKVSEIKIPQH